PQKLPARLEGTAPLYPHRAAAAGLKGTTPSECRAWFYSLRHLDGSRAGVETCALPAANNRRDEEAETMTNAIFESVSAPRPDHLQLASPATAADTGVSPDVTGFYDEAAGSIQYVVADPVTRKSAIIELVTWKCGYCCQLVIPSALSLTWWGMRPPFTIPSSCPIRGRREPISREVMLVSSGGPFSGFCSCRAIHASSPGTTTVQTAATPLGRA